MRKNSLFFCQQIVLLLLISFSAKSPAYAQKSTGKGGSNSTSSTTDTTPIAPPSVGASEPIIPVVVKPALGGSQPITPPIAPPIAPPSATLVPATTATGPGPAIPPLGTQTSTGGVTDVKPSPHKGGKGGKGGKHPPHSQDGKKHPPKKQSSFLPSGEELGVTAPVPSNSANGKSSKNKMIKNTNSAQRKKAEVEGLESTHAVSATSRVPEKTKALKSEEQVPSIPFVKDVPAQDATRVVVPRTQTQVIPVSTTRSAQGADKKADESTPSNVVSKAAKKGVSAGSCEDEALKKIYDLMLKDQAKGENVLGTMFELTAMKLAKRALEQTPKATTFEELTQRNIKTLQKKLNHLSTSGEMKKQIEDIYATYGKKNDLSSIGHDFETMLKRQQTACYFSQNQRFKNEEASAFILAVSMGERDSDLNDTDAGIVWVVERARAEAAKTDPSYGLDGKNNANGNLLNLSTRVTRYLGRIEDGKNATPESMTALIAEQEKILLVALTSAKNQVETSLTACLMKETNNCESCTATRIKAFEKENEGIDSIKRGLLSTVAKSDNFKIEQELKGKMGDVVYDFSNFAKKGESDIIPKNPPRGKYDACGHVLPKENAANGQPSRAPSAQGSSDSRPATTETAE